MLVMSPRHLVMGLAAAVAHGARFVRMRTYSSGSGCSGELLSETLEGAQDACQRWGWGSRELWSVRVCNSTHYGLKIYEDARCSALVLDSEPGYDFIPSIQWRPLACSWSDHLAAWVSFSCDLDVETASFATFVDDRCEVGNSGAFVHGLDFCHFWRDPLSGYASSAKVSCEDGELVQRQYANRDDCSGMSDIDWAIGSGCTRSIFFGGQYVQMTSECLDRMGATSHGLMTVAGSIAWLPAAVTASLTLQGAF
eukprot:gnl/TRDRNA2_/TRDRNA2_82132_c0_seq2.p1 gnl/TRDRNA2_/TRDRNA2_82132_c0~~gnl/TRDRNA2_/TRDRNA2_82132_c0_seq2.p1  ORF type:complete len:253 (-),score=32.34 gnl/TRDRNA2_/TRDRNA2_82132_c0_seq2:24-782(-)